EFFAYVSGKSAADEYVTFPRKTVALIGKCDSKINLYGSALNESGSGRTTKSADLPGVKLPVLRFHPSALAPSRVAMASRAAPGKRGWRSCTKRASPSTSKSGFDARLSVPKATFVPFSMNWRKGCSGWRKAACVRGQ